MMNQPIYIRSVLFQENLVSRCTERSLYVFRLNSTGPRKYLDQYRIYANLLNNKAEMELRTFIKERRSLLQTKRVSVSVLVSSFFSVLEGTVLRIVSVTGSTERMNFNQHLEYYPGSIQVLQKYSI